MYKKIMVPLDGSKVAECVLLHLKTLIKGCTDTFDVLLVQAVEPLVIPYGRELEKITTIEQLQAFESRHRLIAEKYLQKISSMLRRAGIRSSVNVIYGKAAEALGDFAAKNNVDLVIIATHGRSGISRWVWGSVADRLLRSVCIPIMMVQASGCKT